MLHFEINLEEINLRNKTIKDSIATIQIRGENCVSENKRRRYSFIKYIFIKHLFYFVLGPVLSAGSIVVNKRSIISALYIMENRQVNNYPK